MNVLEILTDKNIITKKQAASVSETVESTGETAEQVLLKMGINSTDVMDAKSLYYGVPLRKLDNLEVPGRILEYIPEESSMHYKFVPVGVKDGVLEVGLVDPDNIEARDALNFISSKINMPFKIFLISEEDFERIFKGYKGLSGEVTQALTELQTEVLVDDIKINQGTSDNSPQEGDESKNLPEMKLVEDAPVTKIVATILRYATEGDASDVHIEPMREHLRVRFRVDGVLNTSLVLPSQVHLAVVARIKILSNMKLDEKRKPQDGRFSAKISGKKVDFRVSTFPTYFGEKVVMRILDQEKGIRSLTEMGLTDQNLAVVKEAMARPYGIILITGPTGSGKTTSLYAMLNSLDREKRNVLSLEDPIEYNIDGVSQSQVRPEIGYTFANGLRTTLRQDPDIILVGEIRDKETAQLAIQAALTGHLVLSTLHTNNAAGAVPRLVDMGVDPYLIAPTLILTVAQRLVSVLCPNSGKSVKVEGSLKSNIEKQFSDLPEEFRKKISIPDEMLMVSPTADCPNGTRGRTAIFELFMVDKEIEKAILGNPSEADLYKLTREKGMLTMREDALLKAFKKMIPYEEVMEL